MNVRSIKPARWWALETMSVICTEDKSDSVFFAAQTVYLQHCVCVLYYRVSLQSLIVELVTRNIDASIVWRV